MQKLIRRCGHCRLLNHRDLLLRIRRLADGSLSLMGGEGRSLYLCPVCLKAAGRNKSLLRHLPGISAQSWRSWCEAQAESENRALRLSE